MLKTSVDNFRSIQRRLTLPVEVRKENERAEAEDEKTCIWRIQYSQNEPLELRTCLIQPQVQTIFRFQRVGFLALNQRVHKLISIRGHINQFKQILFEERNQSHIQLIKTKKNRYMNSKITLIVLLLACTFISAQAGLCNECQYFKSEVDCKAAIVCTWASSACSLQTTTSTSASTTSTTSASTTTDLKACADRTTAECILFESTSSLTAFCQVDGSTCKSVELSDCTTLDSANCIWGSTYNFCDVVDTKCEKRACKNQLEITCAGQHAVGFEDGIICEWKNAACLEVTLSGIKNAADCHGGSLISRFTWDGTACVACEGSNPFADIGKEQEDDDGEGEGEGDGDDKDSAGMLVLVSFVLLAQLA